MNYRNILVTGGAGFIGSNVAVRLKERHPSARVCALDSLRRRGSELNLPRLRTAGVDFLHGDIRCPEDLAPPSPPYDLIVECSAEPAVLAGYGSDPRFLLHTNLGGTLNCLELARLCRADVVFLSTSRVYPIESLNALAYEETETRFEWMAQQTLQGAGPEGITESFPLDGHRSLYGATKLASELLIHEYCHAYGIRAVINRCGVVAGPWQFGKVDQGVFALWVLAHHFGRPLKYVGFGGRGKQVRDLLHIEDLYDLIEIQIADLARLNGSVFNVGGGRAVSLSLRETTALCRQIVGRSVKIEPEPVGRPGDLRIYLSDCTAVSSATGWRPRRSPSEVLADIHHWVTMHEPALRNAME